MFQLVAPGEVEFIKLGKRRKITHDALDRCIAHLSGEQASARS